MRRCLVIAVLAGICLQARGQYVSNGVYTLTSGGQTIGMITVAVPQPAPLIFTNTFTNTVTKVVTNNIGGYPLGPTNLQAFSVTDKAVVLGWLNRSQALNIQVIRNNVHIADVASNATSYSDFTVTPNTAYTYQLQAGFADAAVTVITSNPPPANLQAPTGLTVSSPTNGVAVLDWTPRGPAAGYWPRVSTIGNNTNQLTGWNLITTVASNGTGYTFQNQPKGTNWYDVIAFDSQGNWQPYISAQAMGVVQ